MDDKDYFTQTIKRISPPIKTKTTIQMVKIVLQNTLIDKAEMFSSKEIRELYNELFGDAYEFVRDHQHLYVNPELMNSEQIYDILDSPNALEILKSNKFKPEDNQALLDNAIYRGKARVVEYFMENSMMPRTDTSFFIENLAIVPELFTTLQYVASKNVDIVANGKMIHKAALNNNVQALELITKHAPMDMHNTIKALIAYVGQEFEPKKILRSNPEQFEEVFTQMTPIVDLLVSRLSASKFEEVLYNIKTKEMKDFLTHQYLSVNLNNSIAKKQTNIKI